MWKKILKRKGRWYHTKSPVFGHTPLPQIPHKLGPCVVKARSEQPNVFRLITAFQEKGHLTSRVNEFLPCQNSSLPELEPDFYGLNNEIKISPENLVRVNKNEISVGDLVQFLRQIYCGDITSDLSYLPQCKKDWMAKYLEQAAYESWNSKEKLEVAKLLVESETFDLFLATKFPTLKRYGLEGAEAQLAFFYQLLRSGGQRGWKTVVLAMTHRGRLNLLTGQLMTPPSLVFHKIRGGAEMSVDSPLWTGDVLSHLMCSSTLSNGIVVIMLPNPSHLELVNAVSMGKTRAKHMAENSHRYNPTSPNIVNVQVHGDAAFSGQGINQELLAMSRVPHFDVSGTIHFLVNNQVGFTTPEDRGRSSRYASDLAKINESPVIHVNGENPEAVMMAAKIAVEYHGEFEEDVFVEMHCYRRRGHNELDDPSITNPILYEKIAQRRTLPQNYATTLVNEGLLSDEEVNRWRETYNTYLNGELKREVKPPKMHLEKQWSGMTFPTNNLTIWDTGYDTAELQKIGLKSVSYPETFHIHTHLQKTHVMNRRKAMEETGILDWSTAETLAIGSLLQQKFNVRISGQDVGRGTFSHRHVMLVDQADGSVYIPLNDSTQGKLEVANSILSEEGVLGFEYGMSIDNPNTLVIWEAQFGDFFNGAQNIVDTLVASGEAKWARSSSLTILLPHGYDGAGPDHSSCRIERFLQLSNSKETSSDGDAVNIQIAWPSTPAQYFHLLRRQQIRNFRTPLIVVTPKTLLRMSAATSKLNELQPGTYFQNVISDEPTKTIKKIIFTSGKHYYTLMAAKPDDVILIRLESLVPFPVDELQKIVKKYPSVKKWVWSQEEPRNMGAWNFLQKRFENLVGRELEYAGTPELPTTAYGLADYHKKSRQEILEMAFR